MSGLFIREWVQSSSVSWSLVKRALMLGIFVVIAGTILLSQYLDSARSADWLHKAAEDVSATCQEFATQWMVVMCLASYFCLFWFLETRWCSGAKSNRNQPVGWWLTFRSSDGWLFGLVSVALLGYFVGYESRSASTDVVVLIGGLAFGKAASGWLRSAAAREISNVQWPVYALAFLLTGLAFCQPHFDTSFVYDGTERWSGLWRNPNIYGMMMAVATVLNAGLLGSDVLGKKWRVSSFGLRLLLPLLALLAGVGLFKSYSRGAWIGAAVGIGYLVFQTSKNARKRFKPQVSGSADAPVLELRGPAKPVREELLRCCDWVWQNWKIFAVIGISVAALAFWQFRFTEWRPARRVFSIANINDFSWRNRVTAWQSAMRMMVDRPWLGYGWGRAQSIYDDKYRPPNLDSGAAIQMNDYFMLGISAGVPALICFLMYVALSLRGSFPEFGDSSPGHAQLESLKVTCRAGAIVLLVGFWFDGGLFKLATGSVFWVLLELGRADLTMREKTAVAVSAKKPEDTRAIAAPLKYTRFETCLRRAAFILVAVALFESTVLLGTPFLPVNKETLTIARKWLIPPKAVPDLDFLATGQEWRGKRLRVLLQHASLANYNRQLIDWSLDDQFYRNYVLTPTIDSRRDGGLRWRRALWEYFYPPIRKESDPLAASHIVLKFLHDRITIVRVGSQTIEAMWQERRADAGGFEALKVAAFRSVGIPARLDASGHAQIFADGKWESSAI